MALALRINTETSVTVFVQFSGHVDQLEVEICESRSNYTNQVAKIVVRLDDAPFENCAKIEQVNDLLRAIVDFDTTNLHALRKFCDEHPAAQMSF